MSASRLLDSLSPSPPFAGGGISGSDSHHMISPYEHALLMNVCLFFWCFWCPTHSPPVNMFLAWKHILSHRRRRCPDLPLPLIPITIIALLDSALVFTREEIICNKTKNAMATRSLWRERASCL